MVVGGARALTDVEIIDLSSANGDCRKPANYPVNLGSTGYYQGQALVCGGSYPLTDACYGFVSKVHTINLSKFTVTVF